MQRYDLRFTDDVRAVFIGEINAGRSVCVRRQSLRVAIHDVTYKGSVYRVVYDKNRKEIVTFLLPEWVGLGVLDW